MTEAELKAIEEPWAQEPKTGLPDLLANVVPELVAEVRRLRGLLRQRRDECFCDTEEQIAERDGRGECRLCERTSEVLR
jgi:hypothetical protein